jgi:hypothetical protein
LMRKLDGPGLGEGDPMPSALEQLDGSAHELMVQWITQGARP